MRRGNRPTLYELMSTSDDDPQVAARAIDGGARTVRVPVGFLFIALAVVVLLLVGAFALGVHRGGSSARALKDLDQRDAFEREARMNTISEVDDPFDEPGGGSSYPDSDSSLEASWAPDRPMDAAIDGEEPRIPGYNYYIIDHPSRGKATELVQFCRKNKLDAHLTFTRKGSPKVFVLPGYARGERDQERFIRLREQIQRVGVLWNRQEPGQNSDFSTHYAEKFRPGPSGG